MAARSLIPFLLLVAVVTTVTSEEIWQIQGADLASAMQGSSVTTGPNVVTAVTGDGFFIQTPVERSDRDSATSDGLFVFDGGAADVAEGDLVTVSGTVLERYGLTTLSGQVTVTVEGRATTLPPAVVFDSSSPASTQPWPEIELERFEGQRVSVVDGVVTGPSDRFGDAVIAAGGARLFRTPGIEWPGLPDLPVWDGDPERFEINPDAVGGSRQALNVGSYISANGVLGYSYGDYQLLPTELEISAEPALPRLPPPRHPGSVVVASQNMERLGEGNGTTTQLAKLSSQIREVLGAPDILAVQEVDRLSTLQDLADEVAGDDPALVYSAFLEGEGNYSGINVGFLVRDTVTVLAAYQVGADVVFSFDGWPLFDRPPLVLEATMQVDGRPFDLTTVVVHQRSLIGIDDSNDGERVRLKRHEQALWLSRWVGDRLRLDAQQRLLIIGDFNAYEFSDGYVDVIGQVSGYPDPAGALIPASDEVDPDLVDVVTMMRPEERYSFVYRGVAAALDHALVSPCLLSEVGGVFFTRGNADAADSYGDDITTAMRSSDHDGLVLYIGPRLARRGGARVP